MLSRAFRRSIRVIRGLRWLRVEGAEIAECEIISSASAWNNWKWPGDSVRLGKKLAGTLLRCYLCHMSTVTAKQLHQETKAVLNQLERGEPLLITRHGRAVGRLSPVTAAKPPKWDDIMDEVWRAQKRVKPADRIANPVLQERQRRRR